MEDIVQNSMEVNRILWNVLETTCIVQVWARLTPTLTHVVTYELVTSGAEGDAMSRSPSQYGTDSTLSLSFKHSFLTSLFLPSDVQHTQHDNDPVD